jgi:hypothetical protein
VFGLRFAPSGEMTGSLDMSKEDFAAYFSSLEKSSDRARSTIYIFTVVYIAVLFWALNLVYPSRQIVFNTISKNVVSRYTEPSGENCKTSKNPLCSQDHKITPQEQQGIQDIEKGIWQNQLNSAYNDSLSLRTIQLPIFGLTTDRDFAWVIFPFLGILGYYLVWLALARVRSLFRFLFEQNHSEPTRLRLILSTQQLTSPFNDQSIEFSQFHQTIWKCLAASVFCIPILASVITIFDQTNVLAILRNKVWPEPSPPNINFPGISGLVVSRGWWKK